jgi:phage gpG-like protein
MAYSSVTIDNKETFEMIENLIRKLDKPEPLLKIIGQYLRSLTAKMFSGARPDAGGVRGEKWPPLKTSTIQRKLASAKRGLGIQIGNARRPLVATGTLKDSLLSDSAIKVSGKGLVYGTDVKSNKGFPYPGIHQLGGTNLPKRRWLFLNNAELTQIAYTTRDWIMGIKTGSIV